jgi:glycosyltransferase involved in cell wall biosynthesis
MRILVTTVQVPFIRGGAEVLAEGLLEALRSKGHEASLVAIPFKWYPPELILDHMLACRLLDLSESMGSRIDRVIGLKFPAYLIPHPNKILWILHQHRTAYDLWDHPICDLVQFPNGLYVRDVIRQADQEMIPEARAVFTISANVSHRLLKYSGIGSTPLYNPPPHAARFYCSEGKDYLFFPSRINSVKRQELVLRALSLTSKPVRVLFAGASDHPSYFEELRSLASKMNVDSRIRWLGEVTEQDKIKLYAEALGVIFPPVDEDYGYITLEAMLASKPVITCTDSGGPLEFIRDGETGLVANPTPQSLAEAMDRFWDSRTETERMGKSARSSYEGLGISWPNVVDALLS